MQTIPNLGVCVRATTAQARSAFLPRGSFYLCPEKPQQHKIPPAGRSPEGFACRNLGTNPEKVRASSRQRWNQGSASQESRSGEFTPQNRCTGEGAFDYTADGRGIGSALLYPSGSSLKTGTFSGPERSTKVAARGRSRGRRNSPPRAETRLSPLPAAYGTTEREVDPYEYLARGSGYARRRWDPSRPEWCSGREDTQNAGASAQNGATPFVGTGPLSPSPPSGDCGPNFLARADDVLRGVRVTAGPGRNHTQKGKRGGSFGDPSGPPRTTEAR